MIKRKKFSNTQRRLLEENPHVLRIINNKIQYAPEFKKKAVREYKEGKDPKSIFIDAGFPDSIVNSKLPNWVIKGWRCIADTPGGEANFTDRRGRKKKKKSKDPKTMTNEEKIEYYEAKIAYKEAENQLLAEARGLRRWPEFVWEPGENSNS